MTIVVRNLFICDDAEREINGRAYRRRENEVTNEQATPEETKAAVGPSELNVGLGFVSATHGMKIGEHSPKDCISREINLFFDESRNAYLIEFETKWKQEEEPAVSRLHLSGKATEMLFTALFDMINDRSRFATPNAELSGPRPLAAEGSRSNDVLGTDSTNERG